MPGILGFNLHFEPVTLHTLVTMRKIEELGIDACYFRLHACINDTDIGHAAMALDIVIRQLELVRKKAEGKGEDGGAAVKKAWRCARAGDVLSQELGAGP